MKMMNKLTLNIKSFETRKHLTTLIIVVAFAYVYLFAYTAHAKIAGHERFVITLNKSPLIGPMYANFVAWAIPITEAVFALLLIFPPTMKKALWAAMSLMGVFTAYLIYMLASGLPRTCNCGGVIESLNWMQHIAFNIFFISLVPIAIFWKQLKRWLTRKFMYCQEIFKKHLFNKFSNMLRLFVLGLALGVIAVGNSAYTQKADANKRALITQMWVNITQSGDYEELNPASYSEAECQNDSDFICALERTEQDPHITVPPTLTQSQVTHYKGLGLIRDLSSENGTYPLAP